VSANCRWPFIAALIVLTSTAQGEGLSRETAAQVSGTYSAACGNAKALRVQIEAATVTVSSGAKSVVGRQVLEALSYFGNSPPENYLTTVLAQVSKTATMAIVVYQEGPKRLVVQLDLDPPLLKALGVKASEKKLPKC
jgi:hypothetical protein